MIHGRGGVGKSTLLTSLATTRPGCVTVQSGRTPYGGVAALAERKPFAVAQWELGQDDPARPHPLTLASPNIKVFEDEPSELLRKREQQLFDRQARDGGFAFLALPSGRWFSRQPLHMSIPRRGVPSFDSRGHAPFDENARPDLTRDTKQALAYAQLVGALAVEQRRFGAATLDASETRVGASALADAMRTLVGRVLGLAAYQYLGLHTLSFEPLFKSGGAIRTFDELPTHCRHLVAMVALTLRTLWSAYPGRDPLECEAVVAIDEIELHQDPTALANIVPVLRSSLPRVQWIVATGSDLVAGSVASHEVLALRRLDDEGPVEIYTGVDALTH